MLKAAEFQTIVYGAMTVSSSAVPLASSLYTGAAPTFSSSHTNLVSNATSIAEDSDVLSQLYGGTSDQPSDAVGLLNWFSAPYDSSTLPLPTLGKGDPGSEASDATDEQILSSLSSNSLLSAVYNSSGAVTNSLSGSASDWSTLLSNNPSLASAVSTDTIDDSVIAHLSAYA